MPLKYICAIYTIRLFLFIRYSRSASWSTWFFEYFASLLVIIISVCCSLFSFLVLFFVFFLVVDCNATKFDCYVLLLFLLLFLTIYFCPCVFNYINLLRQPANINTFIQIKQIVHFVCRKIVSLFSFIVQSFFLFLFLIALCLNLIILAFFSLDCIDFRISKPHSVYCFHNFSHAVLSDFEKDETTNNINNRPLIHNILHFFLSVCSLTEKCSDNEKYHEIGE